MIIFIITAITLFPLLIHYITIWKSYLFILEFSLAHNNIFYASSVTILFLMDSISFVQFLCPILRNVVQSILVDDACSVML